MSTDADLRFYWDPVCPFAWMTSKWIRVVQAQKSLTVDWRFISLRVLNANVDYETEFPEGYEAGHTAGLRLLRVAAAVRADHGSAAMETLYPAMSSAIFDIEPPGDSFAHQRDLATAEHVGPMLASLGLDAKYADSLDDVSLDQIIEAETEEALTATGRDVGTPIIHYRPPEGPAFFGPVISRLPSDADAVRLWEILTELVSFPGFAEVKRSLREMPQLRAFGGNPDAVGKIEDWHGGSRKLKK